MKAKSPAHGVALGSGDAPPEGGLVQGAGVRGAYVMSKARSSPGGLWLPCALSWYNHPTG
jgi:hypothetical protein